MTRRTFGQVILGMLGRATVKQPQISAAQPLVRDIVTAADIERNFRAIEGQYVTHVRFTEGREAFRFPPRGFSDRER